MQTIGRQVSGAAPINSLHAGDEILNSGLRPLDVSYSLQFV